MERQTEIQALKNVRSRLGARFPDLGEEAVAAAVSRASEEMTGPVRDYVPVLVERVARDRLARLRDHPGAPAAPSAQ
ncbi:three-helix bundle dimerization domain-containing protein [Sinomonas terrae]|uniref:DUF3562 domain-containing protein n=1 Tax=Sinomonas terrae TaxID=2908838 RepID=A0ABS9TYX6_9MICC|nr:hypothetical protein [Sinomonas terrae]MCH6469472.1 hypothetical protein [Sinomonas terrae]